MSNCTASILVTNPCVFSCNTISVKEYNRLQARNIRKYLFIIGLFFISLNSYSQIETEEVLLKWTGSYMGLVVEDSTMHGQQVYAYFNIYKKNVGEDVKVEADFKFATIDDRVVNHYLNLNMVKSIDNYLEFESSYEDVSFIKLHIDNNNVVRGFTDDFSFFGVLVGH